MTSLQIAEVTGFNSRTPCGVRPTNQSVMPYTEKFQFTHPVWGATLLEEVNKREALVSIHAPRVGCDVLMGADSDTELVSIHAPRVGCDLALAWL